MKHIVVPKYPGNHAPKELRDEWRRIYMRHRRANYSPEKKAIEAEKNRIAARRNLGGKPETTTRTHASECESCGTQFEPGVNGLHWDHDHTTGIFRGWLCSICNRTLGHIELMGGFDALANLKCYYISTMANVAKTQYVIDCVPPGTQAGL